MAKLPPAPRAKLMAAAAEVPADLLPSAPYRGVVATAPTAIPANAQRVRFSITPSAQDYVDPAKWLHVHVYAAENGGPYNHIWGFTRLGGTFTDRSGALNPPITITFFPGGDLERIAGRTVLLRAFANTSDPIVSQVLDQNGAKDARETVKYLGPAITFSISLEIQ